MKIFLALALESPKSFSQSCRFIHGCGERSLGEWKASLALSVRFNNLSESWKSKASARNIISWPGVQMKSCFEEFKAATVSSIHVTTLHQHHNSNELCTESSMAFFLFVCYCCWHSCCWWLALIWLFRVNINNIKDICKLVGTRKWNSFLRLYKRMRNPCDWIQLHYQWPCVSIGREWLLNLLGVHCKTHGCGFCCLLQSDNPPVSRADLPKSALMLVSGCEGSLRSASPWGCGTTHLLARRSSVCSGIPSVPLACCRCISTGSPPHRGREGEEQGGRIQPNRHTWGGSMECLSTSV